MLCSHHGLFPPKLVPRTCACSIVRTRWGLLRVDLSPLPPWGDEAITLWPSLDTPPSCWTANVLPPPPGRGSFGRFGYSNQYFPVLHPSFLGYSVFFFFSDEGRYLARLLGFFLCRRFVAFTTRFDCGLVLSAPEGCSRAVRPSLPPRIETSTGAVLSRVFSHLPQRVCPRRRRCNCQVNAGCPWPGPLHFFSLFLLLAGLLNFS